MRWIDEDMLDEIAIGAAILGTGGGGDPQLGLLIARQAIREHGPVALVSADDVPDDAFVVPFSMMGAPAVAKEKLPSMHPVEPILEAFAAAHGRRATHLMPAEIGGIAALIPIAAAAALQLPMVDADMMGRAFPQLPMLLSTFYGVPASPLAMGDEWGNTVVFRGIDNHHTERLARTACVEMGASALMALSAVAGSGLRPAVVEGTVSLAQRIGAAVRAAQRGHTDPVEASLGEIAGYRLFTGKVIDVESRTSGGFTRLAATVSGLDADEGRTLTVRSQNEHLIALVSDAGAPERPVAITPDLIMVLDTASGEAVTTEQLRFGARVTIIAAPCDPRYREPDALAVVGPAGFGYDVEYIPVEKLAVEAAQRGGVHDV